MFDNKNDFCLKNKKLLDENTQNVFYSLLNTLKFFGINILAFII
jgi:hypothetical protein